MTKGGKKAKTGKAPSARRSKSTTRSSRAAKADDAAERSPEGTATKSRRTARRAQATKPVARLADADAGAKKARQAGRPRVRRAAASEGQGAVGQPSIKDGGPVRTAAEAPTRGSEQDATIVQAPGVQVAAEELEAVASPAVPASFAELGEGVVAAEVLEIERRITRLMAHSDRRGDPGRSRRQAVDALARIARKMTETDPGTPPDATDRGLEGPIADPDDLVTTARALMSSDYYYRQWGRGGLRDRADDVDEFGYDPSYDRRLRPFFEAVYRRWFRTTVRGIEAVPKDNAILVANHGGALPWDGVMLRMALALDHPAQPALRWLVEDAVFHRAFLGARLNRIGAVRACQDNASRLLDRGALLAVFPEGDKGATKLHRDRYQLQRFGRGGYVKLALRKQRPIIPVAIVGAEDANPLLFRLGLRSAGRRVPHLPITPTFPFLGPLGLLPLPSRWEIRFGEPIDMTEWPPTDADDAVLVNRLNDRVRSTIQAMLDAALEQRSSAYRG